MIQEEKDINLLLSRIWKDPHNFQDRIMSKLNEFTENFEKIKLNP